MRWKYFQLGENNLKAKEQIFENLSVGAVEHTLTKKLLDRFSHALGPVVLIANELWDLDLQDFRSGGRYRGIGIGESNEADASTGEGYPFSGLERLIRGWLLSSPIAVILCENAFNMRDALPRMPPRDSRLVFYNNEMYHVLLATDSGGEAIDSAVRESSHHWATAVCSLCAAVPECEVTSDSFFDEIVANTAHVFTPAIDGEGYLFWSPRMPANPNPTS